MTLFEMSALYADSASLLRTRITELRAAAQAQEDPEAVRQLRRRIAELLPMLQETRALATLTAHYYDTGYHKHEKYSL